VPALLFSGKQVVGQAVSNSLGEFQMEYAPTKRLRLYVPVRQAGKRIELPLSHFAREREGAANARDDLVRWAVKAADGRVTAHAHPSRNAKMGTKSGSGAAWALR